MRNQILFTGGSGRLGSQLRRYFDGHLFPTHTELDITDKKRVVEFAASKSPSLIVHLAAVVGEVQCRQNIKQARLLNLSGTSNLVQTRIPVLFASTEYVFDGKHGNYSELDAVRPAGLYGELKAEGERIVSRASGKCVRFRSCQSPFPYAEACADMFTSARYVDEIAGQFATAIQYFDLLPSIIHLGASRTSILDLARQTRPDVKPILRESLLDRFWPLPKDTSLDTSLWQYFLQQAQA